MTRLDLFIAATLLLMFAFSFLAVRSLILVLYSGFRARSRIYSLPPVREAKNAASGLRSAGAKLTDHVSTLLEAVGLKKEPLPFFITSVLLALVGLWLGLFFFVSAKGVAVMVAAGGGLPYLWLRMRLLTIQSKARLEFLPAVEVLYQQVVLSDGRNLRNTLHHILQEGRIRYPMRSIFEQLHRNLSANRGVGPSLRLFTVTLGHVWAGYLANMMAVALEEGADITDNLRELIDDMRRAQLAERADRNRLLEIRIANFSPILFLVIFVGVNVRLDADMAYAYYVLDPQGRDLLLDALLLIFASFVMGVYLSVRRR
jgi:Flp pilus assembly protein TadB